MRDELAEGDSPGVEEAGQLEGEAEHGLVARGFPCVAARAGDVGEDCPVERKGSDTAIERHVSNPFGELHTWDHRRGLFGEQR